MEPVPRICKCCNKPFIDNKTKGRPRNYCSIVCNRRQMQRNYHKNRRLFEIKIAKWNNKLKLVFGIK